MSPGSQKFGPPVGSSSSSMGNSPLTYRAVTSVWQMRTGEVHLASKHILVGHLRCALDI